MLFGDFVRSAHARNRLMRVSKAALPGVEAVLTAAELKPLNLHYMPTLAGDVQAALADEKLDFGRSGGLAERVGDAVAERGAEFSHLGPSR
jgi:CO/xanthine dehydrogenase Mo-binding subunit